jgi:hypothetical protein
MTEFIINRAHSVVQALPLYPVMTVACADCGARWRHGEKPGRCRRKAEALSSGWSGAVVNERGHIIGRANRAGPDRAYRVKLTAQGQP